ncbi:MAG: class I SAM-dependent RNA methyltransferase [Alphaproteobacteria bacterium]|nr:class I SAM-dependent RNA methyltransferase [Alphaproteobacteria bacterium]
MSEAVVDIIDMGRRGEGIARLDGQIIFVAGGLPGETVRVAIAGDRSQVVELLNPSPARVAAFCPHYGDCGGCQLQHWQEQSYRRWKTGLVEQAFAARGIAVRVGDLIDAHGAGRRRVSIHVRRKESRVSAGFMAARSHRLLDLDRCPVLVPELASAFDLARSLGALLGDCDVAVTATRVGPDASVKAERKLAEPAKPRLAGLTQELGLARLSVNGEVIAAPVPPLVAMGRALVPIPPGSFLQATVAGEESLARLVLSGLGKSKAVADLFCGCGPFALRIAERARVWALDSDRPAITAVAAAVRATPGLKPVAAEVRDLFRAPLVPGELKGFDAVVFDPPRAGAEAQARQLARSQVGLVVAVSCDPASLARDAELLIAGGYTLQSLTAVDQFKWTSHIETVAVFRK